MSTYDGTASEVHPYPLRELLELRLCTPLGLVKLLFMLNVGVGDDGCAPKVVLVRRVDLGVSGATGWGDTPLLSGW